MSTNVCRQCRLCLSTQDLSYIFDAKMEKDLAKMIKNVYSIEVSKNDTITQMICTTCSVNVINFYNNRINVLKNDSILKGKKTLLVAPDYYKFAHPSVKALIKKYPTLTFPKTCLTSHVGAYITVESDEVDNWYKCRNYSESEIKIIKEEAARTVVKHKIVHKNDTFSQNNAKRVRLSSESHDDISNVKILSCVNLKIGFNSGKLKKSYSETLNTNATSTTSCTSSSETSKIYDETLSLEEQCRNDFCIGNRDETSEIMEQGSVQIFREMESERRKQPYKSQFEESVKETGSYDYKSKLNEDNNDSQCFRTKEFEKTKQFQETKNTEEIWERQETKCDNPKKDIKIIENKKIQRQSFSKKILEDMKLFITKPLLPTTNKSFYFKSVSNVPEQGNTPDSSLFSWIVDKHDKLYACKICDLQLSSFHSLVRHELYMHTKCPFCRKRFDTVVAKEKHVRNQCLMKPKPNINLKKIKLNLVRVDEDPQMKQKYASAFQRIQGLDTIQVEVITLDKDSLVNHEVICISDDEADRDDERYQNRNEQITCLQDRPIQIVNENLVSGITSFHNDVAILKKILKSEHVCSKEETLSFADLSNETVRDGSRGDVKFFKNLSTHIGFYKMQIDIKYGKELKVSYEPRKEKPTVLPFTTWKNNDIEDLQLPLPTSPIPSTSAANLLQITSESKSDEVEQTSLDTQKDHAIVEEVVPTSNCESEGVSEVSQEKLGSVGTELGSVSTELGSVGTELGSVGTELGSVSTELGSVGTELGSVGTELGSVGTEFGSVDTELGSVGTDLPVTRNIRQLRVRDKKRSFVQKCWCHGNNENQNRAYQRQLRVRDRCRFYGDSHLNQGNQTVSDLSQPKVIKPVTKVSTCLSNGVKSTIRDLGELFRELEISKNYKDC